MVSKFQLPGDSISSARAALPLSIMKQAALTPVDEKVAWKDNKFCLAGIPSASLDQICIVLEREANN